MNPLNDAAVVIDIESELTFWQQAYRASRFHRPDFSFDDYRPSLKFAYDAYLRLHRQPLETVMPELRERYETRMPRYERMEWDRMSCLLHCVWARIMRSGSGSGWEGGPAGRVMPPLPPAAVYKRRRAGQPARPRYR